MDDRNDLLTMHPLEFNPPDGWARQRVLGQVRLGDDPMVSGEGTLFGLLSGKARWLQQRQALLAQNVANADTPGFKPKDLAPAKLEALVASGRDLLRPLAVSATSSAHLAGTSMRSMSERGKEVEGFETTPDGNAVILPEQMAKMAHTQLDYELTTNLYKRYVGLLKTALGTNQSA